MNAVNTLVHDVLSAVGLAASMPYYSPMHGRRRPSWLEGGQGPGRGFTRRTLLVLLAGSGAGLALAACGGTVSRSTVSPPEGAGREDFSARFAGYPVPDEPNGDLAKVVWPAFVTRAGPEVQRLYEFQIQNGDLMKYMPCFCGCNQEAGHQSNRDCYVKQVNPDGSVVLDSMAPT